MGSRAWLIMILALLLVCPPRLCDGPPGLRVQVAVIYQRITDGLLLNRTLDDVIAILRELGADFVFRGFWVWHPCPERCEQLPPRARRWCELWGYSYEHLERAVSRIKSELPGVVVCGGVPAQVVFRVGTWNPKTGEVVRYPRTWDMALDPAKWGLKMSKREFQCRFGKWHMWVPRDFNCSEYDPAEASAYFPDITNPEFRRILLARAERMIDAGVDAIWFDMLFAQANILAAIAGDPHHQAVRESYEAACEIIEGVRRYGEAMGRRVYLGTWATMLRLPYSPPRLDFVTISPTVGEVRRMELDTERWERILRDIRARLGNVSIIAFLDWGPSSNTPLAVFSQELTPEQQGEFLGALDAFLKERGVVLAYPVHGGYMGAEARTLSYGRFRFYDSLAPEFRTYNTIRELAAARRVASGGG